MCVRVCVNVEIYVRAWKTGVSRKGLWEWVCVLFLCVKCVCVCGTVFRYSREVLRRREGVARLVEVSGARPGHEHRARRASLGPVAGGGRGAGARASGEPRAVRGRVSGARSRS